MIPRDYITEWRAQVPWVQDFQVEQDLVISKALVDIFSHPHLRESLAFRGATALYKLYLKPPARYSEDIDLVQVKAAPAGPVMNALRDVLDPWLGKPRDKQTTGRVTFVYRFGSEDAPPIPLRLKVEINSREHFAVYGFSRVPFTVSSRWFEGSCDIKSYELGELLATKLRALYQRKQGRDLFDLAVALENPTTKPDRMRSLLIWTAGDITSLARSLKKTLQASCVTGVSLPISVPCSLQATNGTSTKAHEKSQSSYSLCCPGGTPGQEGNSSTGSLRSAMSMPCSSTPLALTRPRLRARRIRDPRADCGPMWESVDIYQEMSTVSHILRLQHVRPRSPAETYMREGIQALARPSPVVDVIACERQPG